MNAERDDVGQGTFVYWTPAALTTHVERPRGCSAIRVSFAWQECVVYFRDLAQFEAFVEKARAFIALEYVDATPHNEE